MNIKYGVAINDEVLVNERKRLINQVWKLIPMKEKAEDWQSHLKIVTMEIAGLAELLFLVNEQNFLILLAKLEGLAFYNEIDFSIYRKIVFKCIDLLVKVFKNENRKP